MIFNVLFLSINLRIKLIFQAIIHEGQQQQLSNVVIWQKMTPIRM